MTTSVEAQSEATAKTRSSTYLRELIFSGSLRQGDRVDQNVVASALGISRQPVREAVQELAADGLLVVRPQHGVFVGTFDADTVRAHFDLYGHLRAYAAAKVARGCPPEVLAHLRALCRSMDREADTRRIDETAAEFFRTINTTSGNERLRYVLRSMSRFVPGNFYDRYPQAIEQSRKGARRILRAIERHDPEAATRACLELWAAGGEIVVSDLVARGVIERS